MGNHFFGHSIETQPMSSLAVTFTTQEINSWIPSQCHYYCSDRSFTIAATLSIPVASFHTRTIALQDSCGISGILPVCNGCSPTALHAGALLSLGKTIPM